MCGRYSITLPPEAIREIFQTHGELPNWPIYYNAPPTTALPVVYCNADRAIRARSRHR
jgi:putative SOS response-associated peptidase YedK